MPKRRPSRRTRRGKAAPAPAPRPVASPAPRPQPRPVSVAEPVGQREPERLATQREASAMRFTARDYGYVKREVGRILILAVAILITIIVLSFFLP